MKRKKHLDDSKNRIYDEYRKKVTGYFTGYKLRKRHITKGVVKVKTKKSLTYEKRTIKQKLAALCVLFDAGACHHCDI